MKRTRVQMIGMRNARAIFNDTRFLGYSTLLWRTFKLVNEKFIRVWPTCRRRYKTNI